MLMIHLNESENIPFVEPDIKQIFLSRIMALHSQIQLLKRAFWLQWLY